MKFCGGIAVACFVEEPPSDVVADVCFFRTGCGQLQRFFLQDRGFVPSVLAVEDLGQDQQQFRPVGGILLQPEGFPEGLAFGVQQCQVLDPLEESASLAGALLSASGSSATSRSLTGSVCQVSEKSLTKVPSVKRRHGNHRWPDEYRRPRVMAFIFSCRQGGDD